MTRKEAIDRLEHLIMSPVGREEIEETCYDVMKYLAAQGPRVMTLEEVKSLERDAVVWYEHNGVNKQRPRIVDHVYDSGIIFTDGGHWQFNADAYGKKFRLWTSRPDQVTREATPWD